MAKPSAVYLYTLYGMCYWDAHSLVQQTALVARQVDSVQHLRTCSWPQGEVLVGVSLVAEAMAFVDVHGDPLSIKWHGI